MFYGKSCIGGVHVFRVEYLTICCVLLENMSYWRMFFFRVSTMEGVFCSLRCHVLLESMSHRKTCITWGISYRWACLVEVHVVWVAMHY